jgi:hypothetical protein
MGCYLGGQYQVTWHAQFVWKKVRHFILYGRKTCLFDYHRQFLLEITHIDGTR